LALAFVSIAILVLVPIDRFKSVQCAAAQPLELTSWQFANNTIH